MDQKDCEHSVAVSEPESKIAFPSTIDSAVEEKMGSVELTESETPPEIPEPLLPNYHRGSSFPVMDNVMRFIRTSRSASMQMSDHGSDAGSLVGGSSRRSIDFFRSNTRRQLRSRLMQQNGEYNISVAQTHQSMRTYYSDMWTTLIEVKWRWALLAFALSFTLSWLAFAVVYLCVMYAHGDFERKDNSWKSCLVSVSSFAGVFLFALETQMTIGYGFRYPSDECPEIIYTICLQSMCGVVIQTLFVGIVFARLVKPKNRASTVQFSRCAVISLRERKLCFMFRVVDLRKTHLASINLRVFMIKKHVTFEGEALPFHIWEMKCKVGDVDGCPFLNWPVIICHTIDQTSPLYGISRNDLFSAKFEIHVILDGVTPTNGMSTTARTSYVPSEIQWGRRLDSLVTYQTEQGEYRIEYSEFHGTHTVWAPSCSARELDEIFETGVDPVEWFQKEKKQHEIESSHECVHLTV